MLEKMDLTYLKAKFPGLASLFISILVMEYTSAAESLSLLPQPQSVKTTGQLHRIDPEPNNVKETDRKNILGLQAMFWSHLDREPELMGRQLWPRLIVIAERGWSDAGVRDWHGFEARLAQQYPRLTAAGVSF